MKQSKYRRYTGRNKAGKYRCFFGVLAFITLITILGIIGGIEHGTIAFKTGAILTVTGCALFAGLVFLSGAWTAGR